MTKWKPTFESLLLLVCLLTLTGCDGSKRERNKAIAEAKKAKAELAKVKAILEQTQSERDELREYIDKISEERESELASVMQTQEKLQYQITEERDAAIAKAKDAQAIVERLREQLKEKAVEIRELEQWNEELQAAIRHLQDQIDQANQQMDEESYEEPNEQPEPNVIDVNDF